MKLKLVVASMSVLGLISCPVLADTQTTQPKHKHHHHHHHKMMTDTTVVEHGYKDYKDMVMPVAEVCPKVDMYDSMLDMMNHNVGRARPTVHCADPLSLAGGIAFDSTWGNRHQGYAGENTARFSLNDAYINAYGNVNNWTTAFASVSYASFQPYRSPYAYANVLGTTSVVPVGGGTGPNNSYVLSGVYSNSYAHDALQLEQGYITFKNMNVMPLFLRIGKMFTDFDRYTIHPMTESFSQVLSESLKTQVELGFMTNFGLNGSVYTFENPMRLLNPTGSSNSHNKNNYGASLNWNHPDEHLGYNAGIGYIYDFTGIDQVAYGVALYNGSTSNSSGMNGSYQTRVSGGTIYGDINSGPFTIDVHYVTALQSFNSADLPTRSRALILAGATATGAKPWAADITGGYGFNAWTRDMNVYLGYQATGNAGNLFLPKNRWLAGYGVNVLKSTNVGIQWNHDTAYARSFGGTGNTSNTVMVRAAVQFG